MGSKYQKIVADFETTTDPNDCRVWAWAICEIGGDFNVTIGNSIESFFEYISKGFYECYFHNLAFDGSFILDTILRNGFVYTKDRPRKNEFTSLIDKMGKFYSIEVCWNNSNRTEFRDSLKKLPMSVARIAQAFQLPVSKGTIDYDAFRPIGYSLNKNEQDYISNDVRIVAMALDQQFKSGMRRLTVGSDSLAEYKKSSKNFKKLFPVLSPAMDADIRLAYRGGFTYADPRFWKQVTGPGRVYDVNSLYPSVMYDRVLPYGTPIWEGKSPRKKDGYPLYITAVTFTAKLKPDHIPCIQIRGSSFFLNTEYQREITEPVTLCCTNVDWDLWNEQYDIKVQYYHGTWYFRGSDGFFTDYIDKWMEVKKNATGGLREIAKLHLNSLYGKFATNPNVTPKVPYLGEDNVLHLKLGDEDTRDPVYTPMGAFITAYAREVTIRAAQQHYDVFAYCDTDSLHLLVESDPPTLDIDPKRLGAWKHELTFDSAFFGRAKCYSEHNSDCTCGEFPHRKGCGYHTHIAGLPLAAADEMEFEDFVDGKVFDKKLLPQRVKGGIVLREAGFTLHL